MTWAAWKRYDPILWIIVAAFVVFELVAHFDFHNRNGMETLSHEITSAEARFGWPARVVVAAGCVALGLHLQGLY